MPYFFYTSTLCIPTISEEARKRLLSISQAKQLYEDYLQTSKFAITKFDTAIGNNLSAGCKEIVKKYVGNFFETNPVESTTQNNSSKIRTFAI